MHSKAFSGNQGKHQNFNASILPYKFGLIFMGMKQTKIFWEKKFKMANSKKLVIANSQKIFVKISQIGLWVSRID